MFSILPELGDDSAGRVWDELQREQQQDASPRPSKLYCGACFSIIAPLAAVKDTILSAIGSRAVTHIIAPMTTINGITVILFSSAPSAGKVHHFYNSHWVYRMPGYLSNQWIIRMGPPTPSPAKDCCSFPLWVQGGDTLAWGEGVWGTQFRRKNQNSGTLFILTHVWKLAKACSANLISYVHYLYVHNVCCDIS